MKWHALALESLLFAFILSIVGFVVSYITDFIISRRFEWWPPHALDMFTGTFTSGLLAYAGFTYVKHLIKPASC